MKTIEYICKFCGFTTLFHITYREVPEAIPTTVPMPLAHQNVLRNPCPICHAAGVDIWVVREETGMDEPPKLVVPIHRTGTNEGLPN